jgi:Subtilase family
MIMKALLLLLVSITASASAKPIVIVVIDTGYRQLASAPRPNFCRHGHADLTAKDPKVDAVPTDSHGHGTHIVLTIQEQLRDAPKDAYCLVVLKYWTPGIPTSKAVKNSTRAFERSLNMKADVINYSSSGAARDDKESVVIKSILDSGIRIISAAGNDSAFIPADSETSRLLAAAIKNKTLTFPGGYDNRVVVVGNSNRDGSRNPTSNWGDRVDVWEVGTDIEQVGVKMTGTSQATAVHTGKVVRQMIGLAK